MHDLTPSILRILYVCILRDELKNQLSYHVHESFYKILFCDRLVKSLRLFKPRRLLVHTNRLEWRALCIDLAVHMKLRNFMGRSKNFYASLSSKTTSFPAFSRIPAFNPLFSFLACLLSFPMEFCLELSSRFPH